ncbi:MAG: hydroxyacid dehydrogenase [Opitutaceae bacterium]|jgi:phosphoglycerate dehydrogenase-like enzyme
MSLSKKRGLIVLDDQACELIYGEKLVNEVARHVELVAPPISKEKLAANPSLLKDVEVIFSGWGAPQLNESLLAAAPRLQAFFYGAGSVRGIVTDASWARGVAVTSAYAMNAIPVSEYTLATILFSLKQGWYYTVQTKLLGRLPERRKLKGAYESTVGLISLGMIARLVRERLKPFDLRVLAYDPFLTDEQAAILNVEKVGLDELFERSDVVSLHTPWLKETEGMITGAHIASMKEGATFINTARGKIVREAEMLDVLARRPDLTAVLDVTWPEPASADSPVFTLPNVVLTPHIAGSLDEECRRMGQLMIDEFDRWNRGEPMKWALTKEKAAILA